jgi:hypothetical protein
MLVKTKFSRLVFTISFILVLVLLVFLSLFLPFRLHHYPKNGKEISLSNLANHTSGLPSMPRGFIFDSYIHFHWNQPYINYDTKKLESYLKYNKEFMLMDVTPPIGI